MCDGVVAHHRLTQWLVMEDQRFRDVVRSWRTQIDGVRVDKGVKWRLRRLPFDDAVILCLTVIVSIKDSKI